MKLNISEKIFSFFHRFVEKKYHLKRLSNTLKKITKMQNPLIFDVGANEGESIEFFLTFFQNPTVYSFEPQISSYKKIKEKYAKNKNINIYNLAFGSKSEELKLKINIKSSTSTFSKVNKDSNYYNIKSSILNSGKGDAFINEETVKVEKIDDFLSKNKIETINILKIDTEGFELNVIDGAKKTLTSVKIIIIEFQLNDMYLNYNPDKIHNLLVSNNFTLFKKLKFPFMRYEDRIYVNTKC